MHQGIETVIDGHSEHDLKDIGLCKDIHNVLVHHYPGHPWAVGATHSGGVAHINLFYPDKLGNLSRLGYLLHIRNLDGSVLHKKVMKAGGELLERSKLPRKGATESAEAIFMENGFDKGGIVH